MSRLDNQEDWKTVRRTLEKARRVQWIGWAMAAVLMVFLTQKYVTESSDLTDSQETIESLQNILESVVGDYDHQIITLSNSALAIEKAFNDSLENSENIATDLYKKNLALKGEIVFFKDEIALLQVHSISTHNTRDQYQRWLYQCQGEVRELRIEKGAR